MQYLDKWGWPVTGFKGRPILSFIRRLIHTRKIKRGNFEHKQSPVTGAGCAPTSSQQPSGYLTSNQNRV